MQTELVAASRAAIERAVALLGAGEVVALPTETVYGLAADARNVQAVAKIFETKERPRFDPLIVHLPARESLELISRVVPNLVSHLVGKFWPGPLTIVLPRSEAIPDVVTAGLKTVAVRMSAHPVFQAVAAALGAPLAAPSANRFGRLSPTTAQHVYAELAGRIPLVVDGGPTIHGLESTIVRILDGEIEILRQGPITAEMLQTFARVRVWRGDSAIIAPGQLPTHYAPRTKLWLVENLRQFSLPTGKRAGALVLSLQNGAETSESEVSSTVTGHPSTPLGRTNFAAVRELSPRRDLREAAANLFRMLRELDEEELDLILAEKVPNHGIGVAINDRLKRAAA